MLSHALRWLIAYCGTALVASVALAESVVLASSCNPTNRFDTHLVCPYIVKYRGLSASSVISVKLRIPKGVELDRSSVLGCPNSPRGGRDAQFQPPVVRQDRLAVFEFVTNRRAGCFSFQLRAPKAEYQAKSRPYYWSSTGRGSRSGQGEAIVPSRRAKASLIRFMAGPGFALGLDDAVDFNEVGDEDEHIFVDNDSRFRAGLMTGALIKFHEFKNGMTMDLALGLEFAEGGGQVLDGGFIGFGFGVLPHVELVFGYSRHRGLELTPGFETAMGRFVKMHQEDPRYPELRRIDLKDGKILDLSDYDGLPLSYVDKKGQERRIFPGSPITNSHNSKIGFGILLPLDIWRALKPDNDN